MVTRSKTDGRRGGAYWPKLPRYEAALGKPIAKWFADAANRGEVTILGLIDDLAQSTGLPRVTQTTMRKWAARHGYGIGFRRMPGQD